MRRCTAECEDAIARKDAHQLVDGTSHVARLANRVLMVAKQEADNSEDPAFIGRVTDAANVLQASTLLLQARHCNSILMLIQYIILYTCFKYDKYDCI